MKKIISFLLCVILLIFSVICVTANTKTHEQIADEIIEIARAEVGYYGDGSNKFNEWYYGTPSGAAWCAVFLGWCADRVGVLNTAVPKCTTCAGMMDWYKAKGEYHTVNSGYVPQKGDIVFFDTDGTGISHHVEFVSESGYFTNDNGKTCIYTIGGNTTDDNFEGQDHVTEHLRTIDRENAVVMGYANPSYVQEKQNTTNFFEKLRTFFEKIIEFFRNLFT